MDDVMAARVRAQYFKHFGVEAAHLAYAPGRVNLIGEHTDYNDGFVLPCAIGFGTMVAIGPSNSRNIDVIASDLVKAKDGFDPAKSLENLGTQEWTRHVRGMVAALASRGFASGGANILISGNVPQGAGLSSSASLGVALGTALAAQFGHEALDPVTIALAAQQAENETVGCACGNMDQLASACSIAGAATLIDCRSLDVTPVRIGQDIRIMIVHSGVARELADSAYNERRAQCEAVAQHFDVKALRDVTMDMLVAEEANIDVTAYRRARHVISENARVLAAAKALEHSDLRAMGALMAQSHASMRDDFEITVPPVDQLVTLLQSAIGEEGGARMTGGGFGGCVVALMPADRIASVRAAVLAGYKTPDSSAPTIYETSAMAGARLI
jgi:galactokinase